MIDGCAILRCLGFPEQASPDGVPVALGFATNSRIADRMAERPVRSEKDFAAHATRSETTAHVVGREQTASGARGRGVENDGRLIGAARRLQIAGEHRHRVVAILWRLGQRPLQDDVDPRGEIGREAAWRRCGPCHHRAQHHHRIVALERQTSGQRLEDDHAEAVDVGPGVDDAAAQLFGSRVGDRAEELVSAGEPGRLRGFPHAREAEVHDLVGARAAPEIVRDDVRGLQVAMENTAFVRELQRRTQRGHHLLHLGHR